MGHYLILELLKNLFLSPDERERYKRKPNQGYFHMQILSARGQTAEMFAWRCAELALSHSPIFDIPQFYLRRRYCNFFL